MNISTEILMGFIIAILGGYVTMANYVRIKLEEDATHKKKVIDELKVEIKELRTKYEELLKEFHTKNS